MVIKINLVEILITRLIKFTIPRRQSGILCIFAGESFKNSLIRSALFAMAFQSKYSVFLMINGV